MGLGLIAILVSFIAQRVFIEYLNVDYLGVNGLFTNIISMLAVVELGLGSAIVYHLYKPLADKDTNRINLLMGFYKKGYRVIALIVLLIGLGILPFLPLIVTDSNVPVNLNIIFLLFVGDAALSYMMSYKRSILYADQKNYVINMVRIGSLISLNIAQIIILALTQNYYLYIIIKIISTLAENAILNYLVSKRYPLLEKATEPLDSETKQDIFRKAKGLLFHKIGTLVIQGTDNIVISIFFGIQVVGLYSNYFLVLAAIGSMFTQISSAITASVGNLLLSKDSAKHYTVFKRIFFANFWIGAVAAIGFLVAIDSFIALWMGEEFILSIGVAVTLAVSLYLTLVRSTIHAFKTAAGIFHEDRYVPILEAVVNLVASLILLHIFGLAGVFMGTICSVLVVHLYSYPHFVYTKLFDRSYTDYYKEFFKFFTLAVALGALTYSIAASIPAPNTLLRFTYDVLSVLIVPNVILFLLYRRSDEYSYYIKLIKKMKNKLLRREQPHEDSR